MGTFRLWVLVLFSVILSLSFVTSKKYRVPVLIWGPGYEALNSKSFPVLKPVSSDDFFNHILKNIHKENSKSSLVLFVEETMSTEDFSSRTSKYETSFPMLEDISKKNKFEFLRSVENPVTSLTNSDIKTYGFTFSELSSNDLEGVDLKDGVIYTINLEDADSKEDRPEMLQRHDEKVAKIYDKLLKKNNNFIAMLTGRFSSWTEPEEVIRVRRQANETARNDSSSSKSSQPVEASSGIILDSKSALIYTKKAPVLKIDNNEITLQSSSGKSDDREKWQRAIFSFAWENSRLILRFRFENTSNSYWSLSQVELEMPNGLFLLTTKRQISAPYEHSFHTSTPVVFSNGTKSLTFSDMQVQPWKAPNELTNKRFGVSEDDTTFFTPPIWTGLIVTGIIGIILAWALSMIMDIRTMDQFDDPKGKTITVNVTD